MRRGPTGLASAADDSGPDGRASIGGLARRFVRVFLVVAPVYLLWRTSTVGSGWMLALSVPWLWSEVLSVAQIVALRHEVTGPGRRRGRAPLGEADGRRLVASRDVEVAVVVSPSATNIDVERTIVGLQATDQLGRITIFVAGDRRSELIELSRHWTLAVHLVSIEGGLGRQTADRVDVILANTELPWVLWLEAGQVPMPDMVQVLDGRAIHDRVAVQQISVGLLNPESLVHVNRLGDDQALERRLIGPARAERGLGPWHGPGSLLRRAAFESLPPLDGAKVSTLSRYSVELKRARWRFDYVARPLIRVPGADSLHPYLTERRNRSLAALEELGLSWTLPGVSWPTRRAALSGAMSTTHGLRQLAIIAIIVACLIAGRLPVVAADVSVLWLMAGFSVASMLARRALTAGTMGFGGWVKNGWRTLGADVAALTPRFAKQVHLLNPRLRIAHRGSLGRMQFLTLTFVVFEVAVTTRAFTTLYPVLLPTMSRRDAGVLLLVSVGVTIGLLAVLGGLARDQGRRRSPRVEFATDVVVAGASGTTLDITPSGLGALVVSAPPVGEPVPVAFSITGHSGIERRVDAIGMVRTATLHESGLVRIGIEFDTIDVLDRMAITEYCALGLSDTPSFRETSADHLASDASLGQLAMVRVLAGLSVVAAVGAVMAGPQADSVAANSATAIPAVFEVSLGGSDNGSPPAGLSVRLHTDEWSEPLAVNDRGEFERGAIPESWDGPVELEVLVGDDRHVAPLPADGIIRFATVDVDETLAASVVGPGGRRRSVVAGDALVPGPYTIRWSVDDEQRTAAVRVEGDQILQIRADGASVLSPPPPTTTITRPEPDPAESTDETPSDMTPTTTTINPTTVSPAATATTSATTSTTATTVTSTTVTTATTMAPTLTEPDDLESQPAVSSSQGEDR